MRQKTGFVGAISSRITLTKEKEGEKARARRKKGGEEKNSNGCTLGFYNGYFKDFAEKKTVGREVPFAGNVFKNPARNV